MGADLYRTKLYKANSDKWEAKFAAAVKKRDMLTDFYKLPREAEPVKEAQKKVSYYYDKMYAVGYYRDSYNNSNLLWQFELDYWTWFGSYLKDGELLPAKATEILQELGKREPRFEANLAKMKKADAKYFRQKYRDFRGFLTGAIENNEPIDCSI